jgi:hypothetical protein
LSANCPAGYYAIGGGVESMTKLPTGLDIKATNPIYTAASGPTGWYGNAKNNTSDSLTFTTYVLCMPSGTA